jgi:hypothetical protein
LGGSKKNEPSLTISDPLDCCQEEYVKHFFGIEKVKIYRQYLGAATISVDEAGYIPYYQHYFY